MASRSPSADCNSGMDVYLAKIDPGTPADMNTICKARPLCLSSIGNKVIYSSNAALAFSCNFGLTDNNGLRMAFPSVVTYTTRRMGDTIMSSSGNNI